MSLSSPNPGRGSPHLLLPPAPHRPVVAGFLTGDRAAYQYLGDSIGEFPGAAALSAEILAAGFSGVAPPG